MKTSFADPGELSQEGDVCESCQKFWEFQGMEPLRLVYLRNDAHEIITTSNHEIPILICPRCDGDWVALLPKG